MSAAKMEIAATLPKVTESQPMPITGSELPTKQATK